MTDLPTARAWVFAGGAGLVLGVAALAAIAAVLLPGDPPPVDVLEGIPLPVGGADEPIPDCLVVSADDGLAAVSRWGDACEAELPTFALPADAPALTITAYTPRTPTITLVTRAADGAPGLARFAWAQDDDSGPRIVDDPDGDVLVAPKGRKVPLPAEVDAAWVDAVRAAMGDASSVLLIPRESWSMQDLVTRCDALADVGGCALADPTAVVQAAVPKRKGTKKKAAPASAPAPTPTKARDTFQANQAQARFCYEARKRYVPDLAGRLEISWTLENGQVQSARVVRNTTGDAELARCVIERSKRWTFPADRSEVSAPFIFGR